MTRSRVSIDDPVTRAIVDELDCAGEFPSAGELAAARRRMSTACGATRGHCAMTDEIVATDGEEGKR